MLRDQRLVGDGRDHELMLQPFGIAERERVAVAHGVEPLPQKSSASAEPTRHTIVCTMPPPARPSQRPDTRRT